jgi:regulator of CtrA degradation
MTIDNAPEPGETLSGFTGGKLFDSLFVRGMALVEETATYLDGPGRDQSRQLAREPGLTYAAWSMELTTRLMQAASWLVMQKAVRDGEMHREDAAVRKYRIRRDGPMLEVAAQRELGLPPRFLDLVERSEALFEQICRLDAALYAAATTPVQSANPVADQRGQIQRAAETGAFDPLRVWRRAKS